MVGTRDAAAERAARRPDHRGDRRWSAPRSTRWAPSGWPRCRACRGPRCGRRAWPTRPRSGAPPRRRPRCSTRPPPCRSPEVAGAARATAGDRLRERTAASTPATAPRASPESGCGAAWWPATARRPTAHRAGSPPPGTAAGPLRGHASRCSPRAACPTAVGLTAEYGRRSGDVVEPAGTESLTDAAHDPSWRTLTLEPPAGRGPGAAGGRSTSPARSTAGWRSPPPSLARPDDARRVPARAPRPSRSAGRWRSPSPASASPGSSTGSPSRRRSRCCGARTARCAGFADGAWQPSRGGAFAQVPRSQSVLQLATVEPADPDVQVDVFGSDLGRDRYTLTEDKRTVSGASTATGPRTVG